MGNSPKYTEAEIQINHLLAERESLKAQLEEYLYIIAMRDTEIENLRTKVAEKNEFKSIADNQEDELQSLQDSAYQLKLRASGVKSYQTGLERQVGYAINNEHQLEDIQQQTSYLQSQLISLQEQIDTLNNRNLLLQQEASRVAELESLLEDAERERDELKQKLPPED